MLPVIDGCLQTLTVHPDRMLAALDPALLATDLADYLVKKGVPFRQAHQTVGQIVKRAWQLGVSINHLPLLEFVTINPSFEQDVYQVFDMAHSIAQRSASGGTSLDAVREQLAQARGLI